MPTDVSWLHLLVAGGIAGMTSGSVISAICAFLFQRQAAQIQNQVRSEFERQNSILSSQRKWKETALSELLGPVYMQLDRTKRALIAIVIETLTWRPRLSASETRQFATFF